MKDIPERLQEQRKTVYDDVLSSCAEMGVSPLVLGFASAAVILDRGFWGTCKSMEDIGMVAIAAAKAERAIKDGYSKTLEEYFTGVIAGSFAGK